MLRLITIKAGFKNYSFMVPEQADSFTVFQESGVLAVYKNKNTLMIFSPKGYDNITAVYDEESE
jgi:hypothetical protein